MDKNIIKEMLNILFGNLKNSIGTLIIIIIIVIIPVGTLWGIYFLIKHFFGEMVAGYAFIGFCALAGLYMLVDMIIGRVKNAYRQAKINIKYKK